MAMRELVTGGAACAVPGSSSSSNPLGALANALIGSSSKTQERLNEIPTAIPTSSDGPLHSETNDRFATLPGSEFDQQQFLQPHAPGSEFLSGFHSASQNVLEDVWNETQRPLIPYPPGLGRIHDEGVGTQLQPTLDAPPQRILSNFLHSFVDSSRGELPFHPTTLPLLGLSAGDKQCIRDRSSIMARHFFADKSEDFINAQIVHLLLPSLVNPTTKEKASSLSPVPCPSYELLQVNALLCSLEIDSDIQAKGPPPGRFRELEEYWNESQGALGPGPHAADGWIAEFGRHRAEHGDPNGWAHSFVQQHGADGWASEFEQEQTQIAQMRGANVSNLAAMEQTQMLAHTLAQNNDPKFQNSKFLQFVSKMSRGELIIDDNQVKPGASSSSGDWAGEFQQQYSGGLNWAGEFQEQYGGGLNWADQFVHDERPHRWANEFTEEAKQRESGDEPWVDEFSKLHLQDWSEEFEQQHGGAADEWATSYDEYLNEQVALKQESNKSRGVYVFSDVNPYVGRPNPLKDGQELFRKGLLSEAVLALEAEVLKNPDNAEGWRLLGIANAENDDDQQAIASMMRAQEVDPTNLEVLLALGVSHTNELEQAAALKYLYGWLRHHPKYGVLAPMEQSDSIYSADVVRLFNDAAQMSPEDADVHIVLGVLYNLSREFDKAIASFQRALELKPRDYSLWNKLGATQANSVQSADAILAYQQAVELKPNYVRAWANMGISYANQGMHAESLSYYVQALTMNPKAENAWHYLRISLSCASRNDMLEACDARNLDILQKEFPL